MILHSDREGNDCIRKLRCHCIQIMHSDIYSVIIYGSVIKSSVWPAVNTAECLKNMWKLIKQNKLTVELFDDKPSEN